MKQDAPASIVVRPRRPLWWSILRVALVVGLGLLFWLAREAPWARTARPREPRHRWYLGIGVAILTSFVAAGLVVALP